MYRSGTANVTAEQFHELLSMYATTQHKNGTPYVAESHYPERNAWSGNSFNHSEYYMHSTNNDIDITGLLGVIPRADDTIEIDPIIRSKWTYFAIENLPYHGLLISVLYDKHCSRYNQGSDLTIFSDSKQTYNANEPGGEEHLPSNKISPSAFAKSTYGSRRAQETFTMPLMP